MTGAGTAVPDTSADNALARRRARIRKVLADPHPTVRAAASRALERLERREDLEALRGRLRHTDRRERVEAVYGLGSLGGPDAVALLLFALKDSAEDVRAAAVRTLGELRDPSTLAPLVECLDDASPLVRRETVGALAGFGDRRLAPVLRALLPASEPDLIGPILRALGRCGDVACVADIEQHLDHPAPEIRAAAVEALSELS
jgi:HEAT repeat protein